MKRKSSKAETTEQKLPSYSWGRTILVFIIVFAVALLFAQSFFKNPSAIDFGAILALPVIVVSILNPLLLLGLQKKVYPITQDPITQMELASAERDPIGFTKITRVWLIFLLALLLIYFVGRWLSG